MAPKLSPEEEAKRTYMVEGKELLSDGLGAGAGAAAIAAAHCELRMTNYE